MHQTECPNPEEHPCGRKSVIDCTEKPPGAAVRGGMRSAVGRSVSLRSEQEQRCNDPIEPIQGQATGRAAGTATVQMHSQKDGKRLTGSH